MKYFTQGYMEQIAYFVPEEVSILFIFALKYHWKEM